MPLIGTFTRRPTKMPLSALEKITAGLPQTWPGFPRDRNRALRSGNYPETTRYNYLPAVAQLARYLGEYSPDPDPDADAAAWGPVELGQGGDGGAGELAPVRVGPPRLRDFLHGIGCGAGWGIFAEAEILDPRSALHDAVLQYMRHVP